MKLLSGTKKKQRQANALKRLENQLKMENITDKQKLLNLYEKAYKLGKMPNEEGLCNEFDILSINFNNINLFNPTYEDKKILSNNGERQLWWGAESLKNPIDKFTPLRETVLCFLIAMED